MKKLFILPTLFLLFGCAGQTPTSVPVVNNTLRTEMQPVGSFVYNQNIVAALEQLPDNIAGLQGEEIRDFEQRAPGLGFSRAYRNRQEYILVNVFVFNGGLSDIQDGIDNDRFRTQHGQTVRDMMAHLGTNWTMRPQETVYYLDMPFIRNTFRHIRNLEQRTEMAMMTAHNGAYVRVRITHRTTRRNSINIIDNFMKELVGYLKEMQ
ncbi:MAG: hypothetical protein FWC83_01855 [Alphaproteobacteria bacterium]|nr:hypothetical protein [Alphaproteobacteria bacterium]